MLVGGVLLMGCTRQIDIPPAVVKDVEAYGLKIDATATPQQVVYVLLRSLRDDVEAAQAHDTKRRKEAFQITFSVAAFSEIQKRIKHYLGVQSGSDQPPGEEVVARQMYDIINHWAPIVGHYIQSFDNDYDQAAKKMSVLTGRDTDIVQVIMDVVHDPSETDPARQQKAVLDIELVKERATSGSARYWRVARVGFRPPRAESKPAEAK